MFEFKKCVHCGKEFIVLNPIDWLYAVRLRKGNKGFCCSYTCWNKAMEKYPKYKHNRRNED